MLSKLQREQKERREAREAEKRAWVKSQPKEERHRITTFGAKLFSTAEMCHAKVTSEGIGRFMRAFIDQTDYDETREPR